MKLHLLKNQELSSVTQATQPHHEEMTRLYERLTTNSFSDSESVRQTILGRMIYLTFLSLTK